MLLSLPPEALGEAAGALSPAAKASGVLYGPFMVPNLGLLPK